MDENAERAAKVLNGEPESFFGDDNKGGRWVCVEVNTAIAALTEHGLLLTDADERVLEALKADMDAEPSAYRPAHSFPNSWKNVLAAMKANPRLTPPAPKKPRWACTGWWLTRDNVAILNVEELGTKAERLAVMRALADARDGAGQWEES